MRLRRTYRDEPGPRGGYPQKGYMPGLDLHPIVTSASRVPLDPEVIKRFCETHGIERLSLFGSVLTARFGQDSDIDMLVEFRPGERVGLLRLAAIERELTELIGRKVDLRTPMELSPHFRSDVLASAESVYAEG